MIASRDTPASIREGHQLPTVNFTEEDSKAGGQNNGRLPPLPNLPRNERVHKLNGVKAHRKSIPILPPTVQPCERQTDCHGVAVLGSYRRVQRRNGFG